MTAVRAYVRDDRTQRNWDSHLPAIACAINSAVHTTTKYSPYKILFGYDMITDGQFHLPCEHSPTAREPTSVLATIRSRVAQNLRIAYEQNKQKYDENTNVNIQYSPGDTVWKQNTRLSNAVEFYSAKLDDRSIECKVLRRTGTNTYALADMDGNEIGIFSTKMFYGRR